MTSFTLTEKESSLLITCQSDATGDLLVAIEAKSEGFQGHADGHVTSAEWHKFEADLQRLDKTRKGGARFASAVVGSARKKGKLGANRTNNLLEKSTSSSQVCLQ